MDMWVVSIGQHERAAGNVGGQTDFISFGDSPRGGTAGPYGTSICGLWRNLPAGSHHAVYITSRTDRASLPPHPHLHSSLVFLMTAILRDEERQAYRLSYPRPPRSGAEVYVSGDSTLLPRLLLNQRGQKQRLHGGLFGRSGWPLWFTLFSQFSPSLPFSLSFFLPCFFPLLSLFCFETGSDAAQVCFEFSAMEPRMTSNSGHTCLHLPSAGMPLCCAMGPLSLVLLAEFWVRYHTWPLRSF